MNCIIENCERDQVTRGLCRNCCMNARNAIKKGIVTEELLVENKMMLPKHRRSSFFTKQLKQVIQK